ncbi:MAG: hypothetical protein ABUK01_04790 [Leptospirales bacterium]
MPQNNKSYSNLNFLSRMLITLIFCFVSLHCANSASSENGDNSEKAPQDYSTIQTDMNRIAAEK